MPREIWVTGVGIVSPAGCGAEQTWQFLRSGGRAVGRFRWGGNERAACAPRAARSPSPYPHLAETFLAARVRDFTPPAGLESHDPVCQFAVAAAAEAARSAGLMPGPGPGGLGADPARTAVSIGTSKGGILAFTTYHQFFPQEVIASRSLLPVLSDIPPDAPARHVAARCGLTGPVHATVAACSTGTLAVIRGAGMIADGAADVVFAGSSDASIHPLWLAAFENMGVLAGEHPERGPAWACRPFDRDRDGFVTGEGAAVLVLESAEWAARRGARPLARLTGWAMGTDPAGLNQLSDDGTPLAEIIRTACHRASVRPDTLAAVIAHGTGTPSNDLIEVRAIRQVLAGHANTLPIVSLKGAIGHLLGAAGAVELAVAALAVRDGLCPGNCTLVHPDPEFDGLNLPQDLVSVGTRPILKTSLGFGGHVAAVVLDRP